MPTSSRPDAVPPDGAPQAARPELAFAQVREDPRAELAVIRGLAARRGAPLRVLMIASGGCNVLSVLACPEVAAVDAVDPNPAQLHLTQLRACAAARLEPAAQLALLGADPAHEPPAPGRLYAALRRELPAATRDWWDARPEQLAFGLNRAGRFEALFRELAGAFAARGLDPLERPGEALVSPEWHPVFQRVFHRERLIALFGERAVLYSTRRSFADHFDAAFAAALQRWTPRENPFLHQVFRDAYAPGEAGLPDYLRPEAQGRLRRRGVAGLRLHPGTLEANLGPLSREARYDLIHTSNITDWMPREELRALFARLPAALAPGGAVLARRLNGDYDLAEELSGALLAVDADLSEALRRADRSFFYQEIGVAHAAASAARP